jgi:hypothetical protein
MSLQRIGVVLVAAASRLMTRLVAMMSHVLLNRSISVKQVRILPFVEMVADKNMVGLWSVTSCPVPKPQLIPRSHAHV